MKSTKLTLALSLTALLVSLIFGGFFLTDYLGFKGSIINLEGLTGLVGKEDVNWATPGAGSDEHFTVPSYSGGTLSLTKIHQGFIPFKSVPFYGDDLVDGGYDVTIKPGDVISKGPMIDVRAFSNLNDAVAAASGKTVLVAGSTSLSGDLTVPSTVGLQFVKGGIIQTSGYNLTINGPFDAPMTQVFDTSSGSVSFGVGAVQAVYPQWWGAVADSDWDGNSGTDNTDAIQAAIDSLPSEGGIIRLLAGAYKLDSGITISQSNVVLQGAGSTDLHIDAETGTTKLVYTPATGAAITIGNGTDQVVRNCLRNIQIYCKNLNSTSEACIQIKDKANGTIVDGLGLYGPSSSYGIGLCIGDDTTSGSWGNEVRQLVVRKFNRGVLVQGNTSNSNAFRGGRYTENGTSLQIGSGNETASFANIVVDGIMFNTSDIAIDINAGKTILITGNDFEGYAADSLAVRLGNANITHFPRAVEIKDNYFFGLSLQNYAIKLDRINYLSIEGNYFGNFVTKILNNANTNVSFVGFAGNMNDTTVGISDDYSGFSYRMDKSAGEAVHYFYNELYAEDAMYLKSYTYGFYSKLGYSGRYNWDIGTAAGTATWSNAIQAGWLVLGITCRVQTAITGCTEFDIGDGVTQNIFADAVAVVQGSTSDNANAIDGTALPRVYTSNTDIVLTAVGGSAVFSSGAVTVVVHYIDLSPPTN